MMRRCQGARCEAGPQRFVTAFSLIELLVAVALVAILTTLYWGGKKGSRQGRSLANCRQNLEKAFVALQIYANDHSGGFPDVPGAVTPEVALNPLVPQYTSDPSVFICPGSGLLPFAGGEPLTNHIISYAYYMGRRAANAQDVLMSDTQVDTLAKTAGQNIFSANGKPPGNNHKEAGGNLLFVDGHAEASPPRAAFAIALPPGVVLLNPKP
jgi:prepilin-type N-terminal cleavage/methylation domain-containing protein/prepilin-type processing-associated H-X9-DG protein